MQEQSLERNRWVWLEQLRQDLRYAVRTLWRSQTFAATTVVTLALAVGLVTTLFGVVNAYVLRPFAVSDPHRLFQLTWHAVPNVDGQRFTWHEYEQVRGRHDLFEGVVAHRFQNVSADGRQLYAAFVSGNYFETIQPRLRLGRGLAEFDTTTPGASPVAVLSDHGWSLLFDRDPQVLGRQLTLNGQQFSVVGVLRPEFTGLDDAPHDVWLPLTMLPVTAGKDVFGAPQPRELTIFVRVRRDQTATQIEDAMTSFAQHAAIASGTGGSAGSPAGVRATLVSRATPNPLSLELILLLSPIFAAFLLVLAAACANVSSVMLARGLHRQREIGIRLSVGASRARIVRQLLTEAAIIAALAGGAALAVAAGALSAGRWMFFQTLPPSLAELVRVLPLSIDVRVFAFALAVGMAASLACALVPALQCTRLTLTGALRGEVATRLRSGVLRNVLVVGQVAVSVVLLVAAVTLARNGVSIGSADLGFDSRDVFSINVRGEHSGLITPAAAALTARVRPDDIAVTSGNPLFGDLGRVGAIASGSTETLTTSYRFVSPEYFPLLRIPIVRGRAFSSNEARAEAHVGIVSQRTAQLYWPQGDAVGQVLRLTPSADSHADALAGYSHILIVGVAKDVVSILPYEGTDRAIVYLPTASNGAHAQALLVRRPEASPADHEAIERILERVDVNRAAFEVIPLAEMKDIVLYPLRLSSWIGSVLGVLALALSVSGLYGLLTYVLSQRVREIGIRMALGATAAAVVRLVMQQSARVVAIGAGIGLSLTYAGLKLLDSILPLQLGNVSVLDVWAFVTAVLLVAGAALLASYFPARRAACVDPSTTLRADT